MKKDYPTRATSHDNYKSDQWLLNMFEHWYDPCPFDPVWMSNGLLTDWRNKTYVNPPYSNPKPWIEKAIEENKKGKTIVLLLKHDSSTEWYRLLHEAGAHILLINKRLKYQTNKSCAFPSALFVLGTTSNAHRQTPTISPI